MRGQALEPGHRSQVDQRSACSASAVSGDVFDVDDQTHSMRIAFTIQASELPSALFRSTLFRSTLCRSARWRAALSWSGLRDPSGSPAMHSEGRGADDGRAASSSRMPGMWSGRMAGEPAAHCLSPFLLMGLAMGAPGGTLQAEAPAAVQPVPSSGDCHGHAAKAVREVDGLRSESGPSEAGAPSEVCRLAWLPRCAGRAQGRAIITGLAPSEPFSLVWEPCIGTEVTLFRTRADWAGAACVPLADLRGAGRRHQRAGEEQSVEGAHGRGRGRSRRADLPGFALQAGSRARIPSPGAAPGPSRPRSRGQLLAPDLDIL